MGSTYIIKAGSLYFTEEREWSLHQKRAWRIKDISEDYTAEERVPIIFGALQAIGDRYGEQVHGARVVKLVRRKKNASAA